MRWSASGRAFVLHGHRALGRPTVTLGGQATTAATAPEAPAPARPASDEPTDERPSGR